MVQAGGGSKIADAEIKEVLVADGSRSRSSSGFASSYQRATRRGGRGVKRVFGYRAWTKLSQMRKFEDQNDSFRDSETKLSFE
jgi:hypothetical protein